MFSNRKKTEYLGREFTWFWAGLSFQAGYVNAAGFLACARFVSHMTGFGTQVGISLSEFDFSIAIEMLSAPASFLAGSLVSALAVDRPMMKGEEPRYLRVMYGLVGIYIFVMIGGMFGWFGTFGEPLRLARDFFLMTLLCFACGMQNACFCSLTRGQIRTTHLTGILTDIGIAIVKSLHLRKGQRERVVIRRMNSVRIMTFFSFSFGSMVSAVIMSRLQYAGFGILIATSSLLLIWVVLKARRRSRIQKATTLKRIAEHDSDAPKSGSLPA